MKAIVLEQNARLAYKDVPDPKPTRPGDLLLRIAAVGICGSDIPRAFGGKAYRYPLILGHEFSALVEEAPPSSGFSKGDAVAVFPLLPKPEHPQAQIGEYALSEDYDYFGSRRDGALAEYLYAPGENLFPLPDHVSVHHAGMVEPAAVALHAVTRLSVPGCAAALVIGGGPIGVMSAQWLRLRGCGRVMVAEPDSRKRAIIEKLGFEPVDTDDTVGNLLRLTANRGADCVIDACGIPLSFRQAIEAAAPSGQVVLLGDTKEDITLTPSLVSTVLRRELRLLGTWNSKPTPRGGSEWDEVVRRIDRDLIVEPLISHSPSLEEGVAVLEAMAGRKTWFNKVLFSLL